MQTAVMLQYNSHTYLPHTCWRAPDGPRYLVERFQSHADGQIMPAARTRTAGAGRYWEGSVRVESRSGDRVGQGYVELTGYGENSRPPM